MAAVLTMIHCGLLPDLPPTSKKPETTEPGESFQTFGPSEGPNAESVFIAGMFVRYGKDYVEICRHRGMAEEAALAEEAIADMEKTVLDAGWDGEWFLRAYDHYKNKIGS